MAIEGRIIRTEHAPCPNSTRTGGTMQTAGFERVNGGGWWQPSDKSLRLLGEAPKYRSSPAIYRSPPAMICQPCPDVDARLHLRAWKKSTRPAAALRQSGGA